MASKQMLAIVVVMAAAVLPSITMATQYVVGDDQAWSLKVNYTTWAEGKMFYVGDSLAFNYNADKHNVLKVGGLAFKACNTSGALGTLASGKDVVPLTAAGKKWYICGKEGHCAAGMKLVINVLPAVGMPTPAPGPTPASPPKSSDGAATSVHQKLFAVVAAALVMVIWA